MSATSNCRLYADSAAFLLAAKEGVWLNRSKEGFAERKVRRLTWSELEHPEKFFELAQMLSKATLTKSSVVH
jgi:hypothetical protein